MVRKRFTFTKGDEIRCAKLGSVYIITAAKGEMTTAADITRIMQPLTATSAEHAARHFHRAPDAFAAIPFAGSRAFFINVRLKTPGKNIILRLVGIIIHVFGMIDYV